jgi:hypothetical protein
MFKFFFNKYLFISNCTQCSIQDALKHKVVCKLIVEKFDNFTNQVNRQATKPSSSATDVIGTVSSNTAVSDNDVDLE